jgi:hypothetical protein
VLRPCAGIAPLSRLMAIWRVRSARLRLGETLAPNADDDAFGLGANRANESAQIETGLILLKE